MKGTRRIVLTSAFAAVIAVMTAYICHIPVGVNGGYIHFGDALIYITACVLPKPYAIAAAVIGSGVADLLTAPLWFAATVIIKAIMCLPFTTKKAKILCFGNVAAVALSGVVSVVGYLVAEGLMFGSWPAAAAGVTASIVQAAGSGGLFIIFAAALDKSNIKNIVF